MINVIACNELEDGGATVLLDVDSKTSSALLSFAITKILADHVAQEYPETTLTHTADVDEEVVVQSLLGSLELSYQQTSTHPEDIKLSREVREACKTLLRYYMTTSEANKVIREIEHAYDQWD
jgi:hypothetical protein